MRMTAAGSGLLRCPSCALLNTPCGPEGENACARCGEALHWRKPQSLSRAWTFLALAAILYIPSNMLPVIETSTLISTTTNTILGGVRSLWEDGDYLIAAVIFTASIVIPGVKLGSMAFLLSTTQAGWTWSPRGRSRLYRLVEVIGRWSMVDIYVGAALVALVQFNTIAQVSAGPAALPFAAVVVLTMMSAISFDPRLIWDAVDSCHD